MQMSFLFPPPIFTGIRYVVVKIKIRNVKLESYFINSYNRTLKRWNIPSKKSILCSSEQISSKGWKIRRNVLNKNILVSDFVKVYLSIVKNHTFFKVFSHPSYQFWEFWNFLEIKNWRASRLTFNHTHFPKIYIWEMWDTFIWIPFVYIYIYMRICFYPFAI